MALMSPFVLVNQKQCSSTFHWTESIRPVTESPSDSLTEQEVRFIFSDVIYITMGQILCQYHYWLIIHTPFWWNPPTNVLLAITHINLKVMNPMSLLPAVLLFLSMWVFTKRDELTTKCTKWLWEHYGLIWYSGLWKPLIASHNWVCKQSICGWATPDSLLTIQEGLHPECVCQEKPKKKKALLFKHV